MFLLNDLLGKNLSMPCKSAGVTGTMNEYKNVQLINTAVHVIPLMI